MQFWLMKSEPDEVSIEDLAAAPGQTLPWFGVRNYQARNFLRDAMKIGDLAFFYHSSCKEPGIAGVAEICSDSYPEASQFDENGGSFQNVAVNRYFDPKSTTENPRWFSRDVRFVRKSRLIGLPELRTHPPLAGMRLLARGNRLSIMPVSPAEWDFISQGLMT